MNKRILAIGSHFDDVELGCSGTLMRHVDEGDVVHILVLTKSNYKSLDGRVRNGRDAQKEGEATASLMGATLETGDFETLRLVPNDQLVFRIIQTLNDFKPDRVYTQFLGDVHLDHAAVGRASLVAAKNIPQLLLYQTNVYLGTEAFSPTYFVDISAFLDRKVNILKKFKSEWPKPVNWIRTIKGLHTYWGAIVGKDFAEGFQVIRMVE